MKKRILSLVLCLCMLASLTPVYAVDDHSEDITITRGNALKVECTCEAGEGDCHAPFCPLYETPENPKCLCAEKCTEDALNEYCDVCYFAFADCTGSEEAADYVAPFTYDISADSELAALRNNFSKDANVYTSGDTITVTGTRTVNAGTIELHIPGSVTVKWEADFTHTGESGGSNMDAMVVTGSGTLSITGSITEKGPTNSNDALVINDAVGIAVKGGSITAEKGVGIAYTAASGRNVTVKEGATVKGGSHGIYIGTSLNTLGLYSGAKVYGGTGCGIESNQCLS